MVRSTHILVVLAVWMAALPMAARAETLVAAPEPPATTLAGSAEPNPLPDLPRPPDQPGSLLQPAPAGCVYGCPQLECPYFQCDPLLDPVDLPHPGWLFDVDLGFMGSSVVEGLGQTSPAGLITVAVPVPGHAADVVTVPMATLDWTVSPRFELGYRLPSGFGELDVAFRFLMTQGSGSTAAGAAASPDAAATLTSRLDLDVIDLDYASTETSLGPCWGMKWRIGLRSANVFFSSTADEPLAAAAAGSGIFERSISDNFWGIGPHGGLELARRRNAWGLGLVGRLDGGLLFGDVRQNFAEVSTTVGGAGQFASSWVTPRNTGGTSAGSATWATAWIPTTVIQRVRSRTTAWRSASSTTTNPRAPEVSASGEPRRVACRHDAKRRVAMSGGFETCRPSAAPTDGMPPRNPR
jgi:hypothetical protein